MLGHPVQIRKSPWGWPYQQRPGNAQDASLLVRESGVILFLARSLGCG